MPGRAKRVSLVQEVARILRNTKQYLPAEVRKSFLSEFSLRMKLSGYSEQLRYEVISSGVACLRSSWPGQLRESVLSTDPRGTKRKKGGGKR